MDSMIETEFSPSFHEDDEDDLKPFINIKCISFFFFICILDRKSIEELADTFYHRPRIYKKKVITFFLKGMHLRYQQTFFFHRDVQFCKKKIK